MVPPEAVPPPRENWATVMEALSWTVTLALFWVVLRQKEVAVPEALMTALPPKWTVPRGTIKL